MKVKKEFKIGLLVLISLAIFIWGFQFVKGTNIFAPGNKYYAVYENLNNLTSGSPVLYKGYKVGIVDKASLHPNKSGKFLVTFSLTEDFFLPENSVAQIFTEDLMGSKAINLIEGDSDKNIAPGDTLLSNIKDDMIDMVLEEIMPLKSKAVDLISNLDSVLIGVNELFSKRNISSIDNALTSLDIAAAEFKVISKKLGDSFKDNGELANSISNLEELTKNLANLSSNLSEDDIANLLSNADSTMAVLHKTLKEIEEANGTIGKLINEEELYINLVDATHNLDRLLEDIRLNPKKYLHISAFNFGRKVYLVTNEELAKEKEITFKLNLKSSPSQQVEFSNSVIGNYKVEEYKINNRYNYTIGNSYSYIEIENLKNKLNDEFPDSEILAFEKGRNISLQKALKKVNL